MLSRSDTGLPLVALVAASRRRAALKLALEPTWFEVTADAETVEELMLLPPQELDLMIRVIPDRSGGEADEIRSLRSAFPACAVVLVGGTEDAAAMRAAVRAGAEGYVPMDDIARALSITAAAVLAGQLCVPREARHGIVPPVLSYREREVLQLAACGLTNSAIAAQLYLSESTVKTHLSSSFRKLGVTSRAEAALALARVTETFRLVSPELNEPEPGTEVLAGVSY